MKHHHHEQQDHDQFGDEVPFGRRPRGPSRGRPMAGPRGGRGWNRGPFGPGFGPGDFGPGGPMYGRGGRGLRRGRGDVRLALLRLLHEEPMHGYQMIHELTDRSGGRWRPSPGSVYPTLSALEDEGLVEAEKSSGKRIFRLTDEGRAEVATTLDQPAPWEDAAREDDTGLSGLRDQLFQLGGATMQVAQAGNDRQITEARKILGEARRSLYLLLADDASDEAGDAGDDQAAAAPPATAD